MKKFIKTTIIVATFLTSSNALAGTIFMDLKTNAYDENRPTPSFSSLPNGAVDSNTTTATFTEFGFSQLLATSIYDIDGAGNFTGGIVDTNITSNLLAAGIPASGTSSAGNNFLDFNLPDCARGQCDIDALSPLAPPIDSDSEGFLITWDIQVEYNLIATLTPNGPVYTDGYIEFFLNSFDPNIATRSVLIAEVTGSSISAANLDIFFDVTFAEAGMFFILDTFGNFQDASVLAAEALAAGNNNFAKFALDTNVNPPFPQANQLLIVGDKAIRQTTLDGSISATVVPEPSMIALLGLSLIGFGVASRRRK